MAMEGASYFPTWEEIELSESYLVCCMFQEAATLSSSIIKQLIEKNGHQILKQLKKRSGHLDCKRDAEANLDLWSQNILLYFLLGKGSYTDEEKYIIMINTFTEKVNDWFSGLSEDAVKTIKNDTIEGLKNSLQEGISNLKQYVANELFGGQGSYKENKEIIRAIAKEQLEKYHNYD